MGRSATPKEPRTVSQTRAGVSTIKAQLSRYLRQVEKGEEVTVTDRGRPVAKLVPFRESGRALGLREARRAPSELADLLDLPPLRRAGSTSSLELLLKDRRRR